MDLTGIRGRLGMGVMGVLEWKGKEVLGWGDWDWGSGCDDEQLND
jgi:hypothetical protein